MSRIEKLSLGAFALAVVCVAGAEVYDRSQSARLESFAAGLDDKANSSLIVRDGLKKLPETSDGLGFYVDCEGFTDDIEWHTGILESYIRNCSGLVRSTCDPANDMMDYCEINQRKCGEATRDMRRQLAREKETCDEYCGESS